MIPAAVTATLPTIYRVANDVGLLLVRITLGQCFLLTGLGKFKNHEGTTSYFSSLGLPLPGVHAWMIGGIELIGGALLILGLVTRPAATLLFATMIGAIVTAERSAFFGALAISPDKGLTDVVPWMFGLFMLILIAHGAGRISLDRIIWGPQSGAAGASKSG